MYSIVLCVLIVVYSCYFLLYEDVTMLLSVPCLTVCWYVPVISGEVSRTELVHIVSRLAKRSLLRSSLWLLAEVACGEKVQRQRDPEEVDEVAVVISATRGVSDLVTAIIGN